MSTPYDFKRKFALLDTNILVEIARRTNKSDDFKPVFEFLEENETQIFITDATKFEFLSFYNNKKDFDAYEKLLNPFTCVPLIPKDIELATKLKAMYRCRDSNIDKKQISFIDCLQATQVIKHKTSSFIITTDVNDYPSFLFDLVHIIPIEKDSGQTVFVVFKIFNEAKWKNLENRYDLSG